MRALLVRSANEWEITEIPEPIAQLSEVVIAVAASGICGTDLHTLHGSNTSVKYPITPGHEFGGVVVSVGEEVSHLKIGDRVVVNPSRTCGTCKFCLNGKDNLCALKGGYGAKFPGGFSAFVAVQEFSCVRIPESLGWKIALLAEPMACVLTGIKKLGDCRKKSVLVIGGGPIGALMAYALRDIALSITVVEPVPARRALISRLGIPEVIDPQDLLIDRKWDIVIDATGSVQVMQDSLHLVESGGSFLIMGVAKPGEKISISPQLINRWEISILGSFSINGTFAEAVDLLTKSGEELGMLVTEVFNLNDFDKALIAMNDKSTMKILVSCSKETLK